MEDRKEESNLQRQQQFLGYCLCLKVYSSGHPVLGVLAGAGIGPGGLQRSLLISYPVNKGIILWVKKHWWHQFCCHRITPLITRWHLAVLVLEYPLQDVCSKGWHMFCAINELDRQRWNKANRRVSVNDISKFALFNSFFFLNYSVFKYSRLITWHTPALLPTLVELLLSCKQELL